MAKKTVSRRKSGARKKSVAGAKKARKANDARSRQTRLVQNKRAVKRGRKGKVPKSKGTVPEFGPTFFLTADGDDSQTYEIDATPHPKTIASYRAEHADIKEFKQPDGKILYRVNRLRTPAR